MGQTQPKPNRIEDARKTGRLLLAGEIKPEIGIPVEVWSLTNLRSLDLSGNKLVGLPADIGKLDRLQTLNVSENNLISLPVELYMLQSLKTLNARGNQLSTVEAVLPHKSLRTLDLSHNNFAGPVGHPILGIPTSVIVLDLSYNKITAFTEAFGFQTLGNLEDLNVDHNCIEELPEDIQFLTRLVCLKVRHNKLKSLPPLLLTNTPVVRMHLEGNQITLKELCELPGFEEFNARRIKRVEKEMSHGGVVDTSICGLTA